MVRRQTWQEPAIRNFRIGPSLSNRIGTSDSNSNRISKLRTSLRITCENGLVSLELAVADDEGDVAEGGAFKEKTQFVTQPTAGDLHRRDARLTSHIHRLAHHAHLHTDTVVTSILVPRPTIVTR